MKSENTSSEEDKHSILYNLDICCKSACSICSLITQNAENQCSISILWFSCGPRQLFLTFCSIYFNVSKLAKLVVSECKTKLFWSFPSDQKCWRWKRCWDRKHSHIAKNNAARTSLLLSYLQQLLGELAVITERESRSNLQVFAANLVALKIASASNIAFSWIVLVCSSLPAIHEDDKPFYLSISLFQQTPTWAHLIFFYILENASETKKKFIKMNVSRIEARFCPSLAFLTTSLSSERDCRSFTLWYPFSFNCSSYWEKWILKTSSSIGECKVSLCSSLSPAFFFYLHTCSKSQCDHFRPKFELVAIFTTLLLKTEMQSQ